jgi:hypothetical protein
MTILEEWARQNCNYVEQCVLFGNYTPLRELPSVEDDLPGNVKVDLANLRTQARRWRRL